MLQPQLKMQNGTARQNARNPEITADKKNKNIYEGVKGVLHFALHTN